MSISLTNYVTLHTFLGSAKFFCKLAQQFIKPCAISSGPTSKKKGFWIIAMKVSIDLFQICRKHFFDKAVKRAPAGRAPLPSPRQNEESENSLSASVVMLVEVQEMDYVCQERALDSCSDWLVAPEWGPLAQMEDVRGVHGDPFKMKFHQIFTFSNLEWLDAMCSFLEKRTESELFMVLNGTRFLKSLMSLQILTQKAVLWSSKECSASDIVLKCFW